MTVAGEGARAIGDARDHLEYHRLTVAALAHAGRRLGDGADQHPGPRPHVAAAVAGAVFGDCLGSAVDADVPVGQPQPRSRWRRT
jgi:hypothetical protein